MAYVREGWCAGIRCTPAQPARAAARPPSENARTEVFMGPFRIGAVSGRDRPKHQRWDSFRGRSEENADRAEAQPPRRTRDRRERETRPERTRERETGNESPESPKVFRVSRSSTVFRPRSARRHRNVSDIWGRFVGIHL